MGSANPIDDVWSDFCRGLEAAGEEIFRPGAPKSALDLAEGHRYLTHVLRSALELIVEGGDAAHPALSVSLGGGLKLGWDNPDNLHHNAVLSGRTSTASPARAATRTTSRSASTRARTRRAAAAWWRSSRSTISRSRPTGRSR